MSTGLDPLAIATEVRLGRMTRENVATKGRRYLIEGRLQIRLVSQTQVRALCRGNGDTYTVGYDRGGWHCDCPSKGRCCVNVGRNLNRIRRLKTGHSQRVDSVPRTSFPLPLRR
jgi:hypothetical protein